MTCRSCGKDVFDKNPHFCPHCGHPWYQESRWGPAASAPGWRVIFPVTALIGSFLPWVQVMGPSHNILAIWNAYRLSPLTWIWLIGDAACILVAMAGRKIKPVWVTQAWYLFGSLSFGVATAGFIFVRVAARVSSILGAPSPLNLHYGVYLFTVITGIWTLVAIINPVHSEKEPSRNRARLDSSASGESD